MVTGRDLAGSPFGTAKQTNDAKAATPGPPRDEKWWSHFLPSCRWRRKKSESILPQRSPSTPEITSVR